jgi:hypothetical protein
MLALTAALAAVAVMVPVQPLIQFVKTQAQAQPQPPPKPQAQQPPQGPAQPAQAQTPQPAQIDRNGVLILIRSTLLALHHGNQTGNYTVLRDLGAPSFQNANTAARLAEIFASQRAQKLDLSGVAVLDPQLTVLPQIVQGGLMRMAGFFPSVPVQVNFELLFAPVEGQWRLLGVSLNVGQATPSAPPQQAPPQASAPPASRPETKAAAATQKPAPSRPAARPASQQ